MRGQLLLLLVFLGLTRAMESMLDLSLTYDLDYPASHQVKVLEKGANRIYIGVELYQRCSSERAGTHIEAPKTFGYWQGVDDIPIRNLWRMPGVKMDLSRYNDRDLVITDETLQWWENERGIVIPEGGVLIIHTGVESKGIPSIDEDGNETLSRQPRLDASAGVWLATYGRRHRHRGIQAVGIDLDSLDRNATYRTSSARSKIYEQNIYALHNLRNLEELPESGFLVTVMPMKIFKGEAAPARVVAERDDTYSKPSRYDYMRPTNYSSSINRTTHSGSWSSEDDYDYMGSTFNSSSMNQTSYSTPSNRTHGYGSWSSVDDYDYMGSIDNSSSRNRTATYGSRRNRTQTYSSTINPNINYGLTYNRTSPWSSVGYNKSTYNWASESDYRYPSPKTLYNRYRPIMLSSGARNSHSAVLILMISSVKFLFSFRL